MNREIVIPAKAGIHNRNQWIPHRVRNDNYSNYTLQPGHFDRSRKGTKWRNLFKIDSSTPPSAPLSLGDA
jgi:hypothetical protein